MQNVINLLSLMIQFIPYKHKAMQKEISQKNIGILSIIDAIFHYSSYPNNEVITSITLSRKYSNDSLQILYLTLKILRRRFRG